MAHTRVRPVVVAGQRMLGDLLGDLAEVADDGRRPAIHDLEARWSTARMRLLLLGEAKRGKSTVGNALLGRSVLPTGALPLTAVATTVRSGGPERIEIRKLDGTSMIGRIDELADYVTEAGNPGNRAGVGDVVVHLTDAYPLPVVDLVDTPGIGSVFDHNTRAADAARRSVDVAILVVGADPPITADERALLAGLRDSAARTLVVLNKIDRLDRADRAATEAFTRDVVTATTGGAAPVYPLSARQAVQAIADRDETAWQESGMARLATELQGRLERTWREDLAAGVAGAALRLTAELTDEAVIVLSVHELLATRGRDRVAAFEASLDRLARAGDDAAAAADAVLARRRQDLDADAAAVLAPITAAVRSALDRVGAASAAELESAGWTAMTESVTRLVGDWRATWRQWMADAVDEATQRLGQLLDDAAVGQVRTAAAATLGVDLVAPAPAPAVPAASRFAFDIAPEIGWTQPVSSALRRRLPGGLGRARMRSYLESEAARLVDKHVGRARSDLQAALVQLREHLRRSAADACEGRRAQLVEAVRAAEQSQGDPTAVVAAADRLAGLRALTAELTGVRGAALTGGNDGAPVAGRKT